MEKPKIENYPKGEDEKEPRKTNRRDFMKTGAKLLAGAALGIKSGGAEARTQAEIKKEIEEFEKEEKEAQEYINAPENQESREEWNKLMKGNHAVDPKELTQKRIAQAREKIASAGGENKKIESDNNVEKEIAPEYVMECLESGECKEMNEAVFTTGVIKEVKFPDGRIGKLTISHDKNKPKKFKFIEEDNGAKILIYPSSS